MKKSTSKEIGYYPALCEYLKMKVPLDPLASHAYNRHAGQNEKYFRHIIDTFALEDELKKQYPQEFTDDYSLADFIEKKFGKQALEYTLRFL